MLLFRRHNQNQTFYFGLDTILLNERSYGNILIYDISRKTLIDTKRLFWYFAPEKILTFQNVITHIMLAQNEDRNHSYYNIFLEKCYYQLPKNNNNKVFV